MLKTLLRNRPLVFLLLLTIAIKLFSLNSFWVENYYSRGLYPVVSQLLRILFGWLPFSIGDLIYLVAGSWLAIKLVKLIIRLVKRQAKNYFNIALFFRSLKLVLFVYCIFQVFWGLNYYRQGLTGQLVLHLQPYSTEDLVMLTGKLEQRLNEASQKIDSVQRLRYNTNKALFISGEQAYAEAKTNYAFLDYSAPSIKPSLFTPVANWFGLTGYYNPFSGEAQLKTTIPVFIKPFVITHEMAHQLGYAKENEANFAAYLTCKGASDINFVYSAYFELFRDAISEFYFAKGRLGQVRDSILKNLSPKVRWDNYTLHQYILKEENVIEPFMSGAYDKYLKLNNQPKGKATYNEVIAYLIAYLKKFGIDAI